jgi:hypothetical protein
MTVNAETGQPHRRAAEEPASRLREDTGGQTRPVQLADAGER